MILAVPQASCWPGCTPTTSTSGSADRGGAGPPRGAPCRQPGEVEVVGVAVGGQHGVDAVGKRVERRRVVQTQLVGAEERVDDDDHPVVGEDEPRLPQPRHDHRHREVADPSPEGATIVVRSVPIGSISTSTSSPGFR